MKLLLLSILAVVILGSIPAAVTLIEAVRDWKQPTLSSCGVEPSAMGNVLVVAVSGRRFDAVPNVFFTRKTHVAHSSILDVAIPDGDGSLNVYVASEHDIVLNLKGAVGRVAGLHALHGENHVAVIGLERRLVSFSHKPSCRDLLLRSAANNEHLRVEKVAWLDDPPKEVPCFALDCAATPLSWPRELRLPAVVDVDLTLAVSSAPLAKPELLSGYAGLSQLIQRGLLRRPAPGEAEAALEAVRAKYVSRFTPGWRPQFGIDLVMTAPTKLPQPDAQSGSAFRVATILVPPSIPVTREEAHCLVAMGRVVPSSGYELRLTRLHQPPPYVIAAGSQKCLGRDQNIGPPVFEYADRPSAVPVPACQALAVPGEVALVAVYDYRNNRGRHPDPNWVVDLRLEGNRPVVLVGRPLDTPRRWRVREAYPGQVRALLLAEPFYNQLPVRVEGLRPEQVIMDAGRLVDWRKSGDPLADRAWRSAKFRDTCDDRVSLMTLHPLVPTASVLERGFDLTVKVWTGREIDQLKYVASDEETVIHFAE